MHRNPADTILVQNDVDFRRHCVPPALINGRHARRTGADADLGSCYSQFLDVQFMVCVINYSHIISDTMTQPCTVYFDTSFYVELCRADDSHSTSIIDELNSMVVRPVISDVIIRELLTSKNRTDLDATLVKRAHQFIFPPYCTRPDLNWDVILLAGEERVEVAERLRDLDDKMTRATSFSIMARKELNPDQAVKISEAGKPILEQFGFPGDPGNDIPQTMAAAKAMLEMLGVDGIHLPTNPQSADFLRISHQLFDFLGRSTVDQLEENQRIQDSVTVTEDRPYSVAIEAASSKVAKGLSNTLRDTEHMMLFVNQSSQIDFLQVDRAQEELIRRQSPRHRIAELGLADRCFSASSLQAVVTAIRRLISEI